MTTAIPAIEQLKELGLPAPVSYMPQTWGWWALLGIVLVALLAVAARAYWHWRRNRYRREAMQRLAQLRTHDDPLSALRELPTLLKRVALSMPVPQAAGTLQDAEWQAFLNKHSTQPLPEDFSQQLALLAYAPDEQLLALPGELRQQVFDTCALWVEQHHVAV